MHIRIAYFPIRIFITYPDVRNLSGCLSPIREPEDYCVIAHWREQPLVFLPLLLPYESELRGSISG